MAPQSMGGVVDPELKVYGLQNVRVIDAGVFPFTIGVPLQQTVYAIAEKVRPVCACNFFSCGLMCLPTGVRYDQVNVGFALRLKLGYSFPRSLYIYISISGLELDSHSLLNRLLYLPFCLTV